jgi:hypothetical protein
MKPLSPIEISYLHLEYIVKKYIYYKKMLNKIKVIRGVTRDDRIRNE